MDKYEFNIKVEQIKKLVNKGDYETAMKIADSIDWRRVRSTSLLTMVAQVYERNEEYQDAKDILLLAFERAPIGKGLLFKLTDLALKEGNVTEAEAYYREFCDLTGDDPRQNLLRYLILEAKEAPLEQRVNTLEKYIREDLDEKWLYKLAELYHEAGQEDACVRTCDKIMLMFGLGKYVDKAMELKLLHAPLTDYQMDLVENREKYEEKLRAVEQRFTSKKGLVKEEDFDEEEDFESEDGDNVTEYENNEEQPLGLHNRQAQDPAVSLEEDLIAKMHEEEAERDLAKEVSMLDSLEEEDSPMGATRVLGDLRDIKQLRPSDYAIKETAAALEQLEDSFDPVKADIKAMEEDETIIEDWDLDLEPEEEEKNHLMIEAENPENGLALALDSLKKIHRESGSKNPVAKISGENLNRKGIFAVSDRLAGKDLIVEHAADLNAVTVTELSELMEQDNTGMIVVLIDTPLRMERLHNSNPGLAGKFQYIGCDKQVYDNQNSEFRMQTEQERARKRQMLLEEQEARFRAIREEEALKQQAAREEAEAQRKQAEYEAVYAAKVQAGLEAVDYYAEEDASTFTQPQQQIPYAQEESYLQNEAYSGESEHPQESYEDSRYAQEEQYIREEPYIPAPNYEEGSYAREESPYTKENLYAREAQDVPEEQEFKEPLDGENSPETDEDREMDVEEFAQYACKYAAEIDCSISGKSMLALYERAEMMEEDGIPLTKAGAEELLEEAADKAEKHSFGGLFSSKYDKDGLLILKEKHFFD